MSKKNVDLKYQSGPQLYLQASQLASRRGTVFKPAFKNPFNKLAITPKNTGRTSVKVMALNPVKEPKFTSIFMENHPILKPDYFGELKSITGPCF